MKSIHVTNLATIDLNLLVALDALVTEGHVGRAARKIGRSQPAVSHSLGRLRALLNDPLLVRVGSRMALTPRAVRLKPHIAETLDRVRALLAADTFDPKTSARRFSILMPDHLADLIIPPLVKRIRSEAPLVTLEVVPWETPASLKPDRLRSLDLYLSCSNEEMIGFVRQRLFLDTEVVAVRRRHPLAGRLKQLKTFLESPHVAVIGRGRTEDPVDAWLREKRLERRIGLCVPSYLQALHVVSMTDLVAFVPRRLGKALEKPLSLSLIRGPIDPGRYEEFLFFPQRALEDPASLWLRNLITRIGARLE
jgi:DNA-binding transcriptional LysR family regulator